MTERKPEAPAAPEEHNQAIVEEGVSYRNFIARGNPSAPTISFLESVKQPEIPLESPLTRFLRRLPGRRR